MSLIRNVQEELLERLGNVGIAARHAVESVLSGQHRSLHRGLSVEFVEHRPYQPGDDLRHLDWQVYARTDRYDIRVYEEETRLRATLVVDCSGSMGYGQSNKLHYASMLSAALGFVMARQGDAVGLALCDHRIREHIPPRSTMAHLLQILSLLEQTPPGGETALSTVLDDLAVRVKRRGLVLLISDCIDDPDGLVRALRHLRHRKQDVRVFHIIDPDEEAFPFQGTLELVGMEDEPRLKVDGDRIRRRYQEALQMHRQRLEAGCHAAGVQLSHCRTDEDIAMVLHRALAQQGPQQGRGRR